MSRWLIVLALVSVHQGVMGQRLANATIGGYRGLWFELGQPYPYGDKYSGGLATYTAKHMPLAIYVPEAEKTFFVYGGTTAADERHLLCMIGTYDHRRKRFLRPTVVYDKGEVDDPHDNPSLSVDRAGYLWVFVSGRGNLRPGIKLRSRRPYRADAFDIVAEETFTYPQVWPVGDGFFHFFTKYSGRRELYYETSQDGVNWTDDRQLAGIREAPGEQAGHYQVSGHYRDGEVIGTFFNRHPDGNVDRRTDLYYVQTTDLGKNWTDVSGNPLSLPLRSVESPARVADYAERRKNVYLKDMRYDASGRPICLYLTSGGHEPGPGNAPYEFRVTYFDGAEWVTETVCRTDHNYDTGSLLVGGPDGSWRCVLPSGPGPQAYGVGGEIELWSRNPRSGRWRLDRAITTGSERNPSYVRRVINGVPPLQLFWCDGNPHAFSISRLYFGDEAGRVWRLPYRMRGKGARLNGLRAFDLAGGGS